MVLLKTTVVVLLAVACVSAAKQSQDHAELNANLPAESIKPFGTNTTLVPPTTQTISTTSSNTSTTSDKPPTTTSTTTTSSTTTLSPNNTTTTHVPTTPSPNVTTTTHVPTTPSPNVTTTTHVPTTPSPNVTTTTPEPSPAPTPARSWDGPSFLGGMVLAFGIVAVGFVGYRFFYLGRGGAYHTL